MIAVPALAPVTVPLTTVAFVLLLDQVPPLVASVRLVVLPTHIDEFNGVIATGAVFTVTGLVVIQPDAFVNVMLAVPVLLPVTIPVKLPMLAMLPLLLLQLPLPSDNVVLVPEQMLNDTVGVIVAGRAFTVTLAVVIQLPML